MMFRDILVLLKCSRGGIRLNENFYRRQGGCEGRLNFPIPPQPALTAFFMQKTIWKFELEVKDKQFITLPQGAELLSVQVQNETPCLWALVNPNNEIEERCLEVFGTGHRIYYDMGVARNYIGTFQMIKGDLVCHLFERL